MSTLLIGAAVLLVLIGAMHSVLGEILFIRPLIAHESWPVFAEGRTFNERTLRFAWHLTTLAFWAFAALLALYDFPSAIFDVVTGTMLAMAVLTYGVSRGTHFAWAVFLAIAACTFAFAHGSLLSSSGAKSTIGLATAGILGALSALHVHWALSADAVPRAALPEIAGRPAFRPGPAITLFVAAGLFLASALVLLATGVVGEVSPPSATTAVWLLGAVFAARCVGDFRYAGLFKREFQTPFARADSLLFAPLCSLIALGCFIVAAARP